MMIISCNCIEEILKYLSKALCLRIKCLFVFGKSLNLKSSILCNEKL